MEIEVHFDDSRMELFLLRERPPNSIPSCLQFFIRLSRGVVKVISEGAERFL